MAALREVLAHFGIEVDTEKLKKADVGIQGVIDKVKEFASAGIIGVAVKKLSDFSFEAYESADALKKQAAALGAGVQGLQAIQYAGDLAGASAEALNLAIGKLQRGAQEVAETGKGPMADAFKAIGLSVKDLNGDVKSAEDLFEQAADALASIEDPAKKAKAAQELFGRGYQQLIPLIDGGSEEIRKARRELEEFGLLITDDFADAAEALNDQVTRVHKAWEGFKLQLATKLLPIFTIVVDKIVAISKVVLPWIRQTNLLEAALVLLAGGAIGPLVKILGFLATTALRAAAPWIILTLAIEDFLGFLQGRDSLIGRALDGLFGKGTQDNVRAWFTSAKQAVLDWLGEAQAKLASLKGVVQDSFGTIVDTAKDVSDWFNTLASDTYYLESALIVLGTVAAVQAVKALISLGAAVIASLPGLALQAAAVWASVPAWIAMAAATIAASLPVIAWVAAIGAAIFILEQLIATFMGGDTILKRFIDNIFGEGTTAQVIGWCKNLAGAVGRMFTDLWQGAENAWNKIKGFFGGGSGASVNVNAVGPPALGAVGGRNGGPGGTTFAGGDTNTTVNVNVAGNASPEAARAVGAAAAAGAQRGAAAGENNRAALAAVSRKGG